MPAGRPWSSSTRHRPSPVDEVEAGSRVSGTIRLALQVSDSEATARRLVAAGAEAVAPPVTALWGDRNARIRAPDGMQLTLFTAG